MQILKNISTVGLDSHPSIISMYIALNIYIEYIFKIVASKEAFMIAQSTIFRMF